MTHTLTGTFRCHREVPSTYLAQHFGGKRDVIVYLPPGYNDSENRYPVIYMQDGQNLFDRETAFCHQEWRMDETAEELIRAGCLRPLIIVGIYNSGERRLAEYTPSQNREGHGGGAQAYARFLTEELKPWIDSEYRTLSGAENTALGGSSLGGLVTLYAGLHYSRVFGRLIVMSPSIWWAERGILEEISARKPGRQKQRIWLDTGTCEGLNPARCVEDTRDLHSALIRQGWRDGKTLRYVEDEGAGHGEQAWGARIRDALLFHYGVDVTTS